MGLRLDLVQPLRDTKTQEPRYNVQREVEQDPWLEFFVGGEIYLDFLIVEKDGRVWSRDIRPSMCARSIGTSLTMADAKRSIEIERGLHDKQAKQIKMEV